MPMEQMIFHNFCLLERVQKSKNFLSYVHQMGVRSMNSTIVACRYTDYKQAPVCSHSLLYFKPTMNQSSYFFYQYYSHNSN